VSEKLAQGAGALLARGTSRRGFLRRTALIGAAASVAPMRYLLRPEPAMAVVRPGNCGGGSKCADGFTEFCGSIRKDKANKCPANSYVAGWWKCSRYRGGKLCRKDGARFYVDCNRRPGRSCGCKCGRNRCGFGRTCCNNFRYGQCNTQIGGVTEVVCRVVTCTRPWKIREFNCNRTLAKDNRTCGHEAACGCGDCTERRDKWTRDRLRRRRRRRREHRMVEPLSR
jgi:hypothetical protein